VQLVAILTVNVWRAPKSAFLSKSTLTSCAEATPPAIRTTTAAIANRRMSSPPLSPGNRSVRRLSGPGSQGVAAQRVRDVGDLLLRTHAVPGLVEGRGEHGDAKLAGRDGDDAAAHPALGGQPG